MKQRKVLAAGAVATLVLSLGWITSAFVQDGEKYPAQSPGEAMGSGFPDLGAALLETEGCLGVEEAQTASGKSVIFAWFESKAACAEWYWSDVHQGAAGAFFPDRDRGDHEPLKDVPDNVGPVLAIASITMATEQEIDEVAMPIKQIAIELYTPLKGGLAIGGSFAPEDMVVPKRKVIAVEDE